MKVSIITPFYEGDRYMDEYIECIEANRKHLLDAEFDLEVVLVNDSPWVKLDAPKNSNQYIKIVTNNSNQGIHYSRVAGLAAASGEYIMFLDQDDLLKDDALIRMCRRLDSSKADLLIANASLEQRDGSYLTWYRTDYHWNNVWRIDTYLDVGIQIISPGQCLIKSKAIPSFWKDKLVRVNGADDYYLWLLMMAKGAVACTLDEVLYIHKYTGSNISSETVATDASVYDFMELLHDCDYFKQEQIIRLHEMISYKAQFRKSGLLGKLGCSLANLRLFFVNISYKKRTKTRYGFNR